jgi:hypothetical protein
MARLALGYGYSLSCVVAAGCRTVSSMKAFLYRCPNTGFRVQGLTPDADESERAAGVFVGVTCLACGRLHLVNPKTGETAGEDSEYRS